MRLIECVPNISEGKDRSKIDLIAAAAAEVEGVMLLDVDPGASTHRTVITIAGEPEKVAEAAFRLIKRASELIDMSKHKGEHPRQGATDVCPFIPIAGVSMEECIAIAKQVGERVGRELGVPVYLYENAASTEERRNLASCRKGEYEAIEKITTAEWKPDFGPSTVTDQVKKSGITTIGAREFLVAYNVNLNTTSTRRANAIAFDIREAGRIVRDGDPLTGKPILDDQGEPVRIPGTLKSVKGIGWYIEEYGIAQLSLNLTNINVTPVHIAFEESVAKAAERGIRVTGSELVGLIPLQSMLDAADYFLKKQQRSLGISEREKIHIAIKSLGLDDLAPFKPEEKIIEYVIAAKSKTQKRLVDLDLVSFCNETASESPAPGGGSISAYCGAMGASLGAMVANLSAHKRGWDDRWEEFSDWAVKALDYQKKLLALVDEDTKAFNTIMEAFGLPKGTDDEKKLRSQAIEDATRYAIEVPLQTARLALESMGVLKEMVMKGNPNSVTDGAVGALCARTAVIGACMNARINVTSLKDKEYAASAVNEAQKMEALADLIEREIRDVIAKKM
jgi:glutamate formiminotransferase/formiminotetrahydrofolate cyclodeaminase